MYLDILKFTPTNILSAKSADLNVRWGKWDFVAYVDTALFTSVDIYSNTYFMILTPLKI